MIQLTSNPTEEACTRLERCKRARDALEDGEEVPLAIQNCYRHPEVKTSIIAEAGEKCAYCESKVTHVYWGDVEHILPKTRFPDLSLEYSNLTFSCAICNNKKRSYYSECAPILHPYTDIPEDQLVGLGPLIWHRKGSSSGERTITLLELNRDNLIERRKESIQRLSALADRYIREPNGPVKEALYQHILDEMEDSAEFALIVRSFLLSVYNIERDADEMES